MSLGLEELEDRLGRLLSAGVALSTALLCLGLTLELLDLAQDWAWWLLPAGLMILMATPIMRVIVSLAAYVREQDWFFVGLTAIVLCVLILTLTAAFGLMS